MTRTTTTALQIAAALLLLTAWPRTGPAEAATGEDDAGRWNDVDLLEWVGSIGGPESRYDHLESVQSFERVQRAIEEVKQMVLHDARTEQEASEGLRMI